MQIVGPKVKLVHIKRTKDEDEETADGTEITWGNPIRFEGVMTLLKGVERQTYQQMGVTAQYKMLTNYLAIREEDRVERNSVTYDVKLVDNSFLADKILVILLGVKK